MDIEALQAALHAAVDTFCEEYAARVPGPMARPVEGCHVLAIEASEPFSHRFPDGKEEQYDRGTWYDVLAEGMTYRVRIGWAVREVWGRPRRRAVVFHEPGGSRYPWTEFVETDHDGRFAAVIPDPGRPRRSLADGDVLPVEFAGDEVMRTDVLFEKVSEGPSLRLVVTETDETRMVRHGYWVAALREHL